MVVEPTDAMIERATSEAREASQRGDEYFVWYVVLRSPWIGQRRLAHGLNQIAAEGWRLVAQSASGPGHAHVAFTFERRRWE